MRGSWNQGPQWQFVSDPKEQLAADGGSGEGSVQLKQDELAAVQQNAMRTASNPSIDPTTGAELGAAASGKKSSKAP
jgi:Mn-containing catalase